MNFGVFYTCYTEVDAVDFSIKTLKDIYPDCPVYLVSDGGSDYSFLEKKYSNVKTTISWDSRGISQSLTKEKWDNPEKKQQVLKSIEEFFLRNKQAMDYCNTESILIMEPDVLVRGKLKTFPDKKNALLGTRVNKPDHEEFFKMCDIIKTLPNSVMPTHFGSTPAFYNAKAMEDVINFVSTNKEIVKKLVDTDWNFVCYDLFLTVLFAACGYHEVFNPDIIECIRNRNWVHTDHPLVHQFRKFYPEKNSGYNGRHAIDL